MWEDFDWMISEMDRFLAKTWLKTRAKIQEPGVKTKNCTVLFFGSLAT